MFTVGFLLLSVSANLALYRSRQKASAKLKNAEKDTRKYRRLKSRLEYHLENWDRLDYCENCHNFSSRHRLDCPTMQVRFAITKAEQGEA